MLIFAGVIRLSDILFLCCVTHKRELHRTSLSLMQNLITAGSSTANCSRTLAWSSLHGVTGKCTGSIWLVTSWWTGYNHFQNTIFRLYDYLVPKIHNPLRVLLSFWATYIQFLSVSSTFIKQFHSQHQYKIW